MGDQLGKLSTSSSAGIKKRGFGTRSWIQVEAATGQSQVIELDKSTVMRRFNLPARDLRLLDPLFVYPSTLLGREKAIVVNLDTIRCVITADEVLILNSLDDDVVRFVVELRRRLPREESESLPFEFRAFEVALETACSFLDGQVGMFDGIHPFLDYPSPQESPCSAPFIFMFAVKIISTSFSRYDVSLF